MKIKFLKASKGDCFLISFQDENSIYRNILIDSGVSETYFDSTNNLDGELKIEIERIKKDKQKIDLLILTHIDNDHILGLLKWFEMDSNACRLIDDVWFNSGKLIAETFNKPENKDLDKEFKIFKTTETGINEAVNFEKYLLDNDIWERKIIRKGMSFSDLGVKIEVISPEKKQLKKLLKEYRSTLGENTYTAGNSKDWNDSFKSLVEYETPDEIHKRQEYRPANCSSITFILEIQSKKFLFLADGNANKIANALKEKGYNKEHPLDVEFMKVSHHGSKNNTCKKLLEIIKTNNYLISTDSSSNGHPNKLSLARILNNNPNAVFHFNYEHVKSAVISKQDYDDFQFMKAFVTPEFQY